MINYKEVVDYLNTLILDDNGKEWYRFEFSQFYSGEETIILIDLIDGGYDNKYSLYHSTLCDNINTNEDLINCCIEELQNQRSCG